MNITWSPFWYEMDQTIVVGDTDYFYLSSDGTTFDNGEISFEDQEVYARVMKIVHPQLGEVQGILAVGLCYRVFIGEGNVIQIDAEENIGKVEYPPECEVDDWKFEVELKVQKRTGFSSMERLNQMTEKELLTARTEKNEKYNKLLGI